MAKNKMMTYRCDACGEAENCDLYCIVKIFYHMDQPKYCPISNDEAEFYLVEQPECEACDHLQLYLFPIGGDMDIIGGCPFDSKGKRKNDSCDKFEKSDSPSFKANESTEGKPQARVDMTKMTLEAMVIERDLYKIKYESLQTKLTETGSENKKLLKLISLHITGSSVKLQTKLEEKEKEIQMWSKHASECMIYRFSALGCQCGLMEVLSTEKGGEE